MTRHSLSLSLAGDDLRVITQGYDAPPPDLASSRRQAPREAWWMLAHSPYNVGQVASERGWQEMEPRAPRLRAPVSLPYR